MNKIIFFLLLSVFIFFVCNYSQVNFVQIDKMILSNLEHVEYHIIYEDNNENIVLIEVNGVIYYLEN